MGPTFWKPLLIMLVLAVFFNLLYGMILQQSAERGAEISYSRFRQELTADNIGKVTLKGASIKGEFRTKVAVPVVVQGKQTTRSVTVFSTTMPAIADPHLMD